MAIEGNSPEQRNLSVTSLAFIAYYLADGKFEADEEVTLVLVNLSFGKPEVLAGMAWVMLGWFLYRYWVVHRASFRIELQEELKSWNNEPFLREYVGQVIRKTLNPGETLSQVEPVYLDCLKGPITLFNVRYRYTNSQHQTNAHTMNVQFNTRAGRKVLRKILINVFFSKPSFSTHIVPYVLCALAVVLGMRSPVVELISIVTAG